MSKIIHTFISGGAWKSVAGGLAATVAYLAPVVDDGVMMSEVLFALGAFLVGSGVVYATKNRQPAV